MIHRRCVCIYSRSLLFFLTHRQLLLATAKLLLLLFMTRYTQRRQRQCSISNLTPVGFEHSNNRNGQNSFQNDGGFQQREDSFSFSSQLKQVRKKRVLCQNSRTSLILELFESLSLNSFSTSHLLSASIAVVNVKARFLSVLLQSWPSVKKEDERESPITLDRG